MKTKKDIARELHDELLRELVRVELKLDEAHLWEPLKKQESICVEMRKIEEKIALLEKRYPNLVSEKPSTVYRHLKTS